MDYIAPKNWGEFQHYKDRSPQWIKLHKSLLDNIDYHRLPVASRALAPCIWLLASEYSEGKIPLDYEMMAFRFRMPVKDLASALSPLIQSSFFVCYQDASTVLAECLPREEKSRVEKSKGALSRFSDFWSVYPRRDDKAKAEKTWAKQNLDKIADTVIDGAKAYAQSKIGSERQYIALPTTWLNGKRWEDEKPIDKQPVRVTIPERKVETEAEKAERKREEREAFERHMAHLGVRV